MKKRTVGCGSVFLGGMRSRDGSVQAKRGGSGRPALLLLLLLAGVFGNAAARETGHRSLPEPLDAWRTWATWDDRTAACPRSWQDAKQARCFWPSILKLDVDSTGARGVLDVTFFSDGWLPLPGGEGIWPVSVRVNGEPRPILERAGQRPAVRLEAGNHRVESQYVWRGLPQFVALPKDYGIVALTLEGQPVDRPVWDARGHLWFRRDDASSAADKDFLSLSLYGVIRDGVPLSWQGEIELVVSGKSREEDLGAVLPHGWLLSSMDAPIPVAMDDAGRMKAQVRAGKWTVRVQAFRLSHPDVIRFASGLRPAASEMLVGFSARPDFRLVEILDLTAVDVNQTSFPADWRGLPVYRWDTATTFRLVERMRGMGTRAPEGLKIERNLWLDDDGAGFTFKDSLVGVMQMVWRLDALPEQELGSVRAAEEGLLITRNPETGAPGVELRARAVQLEAVGRLARGRDIPASGWMMPAESVDTTLHLPPGYRLLALWGADWVRGDWLTAWSLMDLFLLLIFTMAVIRLWGGAAGVVALLSFVVSYHEPGAPRAVWLFLLMPLALQRVAGRAPRFGRLLTLWKWVVAVILVLQLAPFAARQVQQAIYPQLERVRGAVPGRDRARSPFAYEGVVTDAAAERQTAPEETGYWSGGASVAMRRASAVNLKQDAKAKIQTGPGIPDWTWRSARFGLSGPVDPSQRVRLFLIPMHVERAISMIRVLLALGLAFVLLGRKQRGPRTRSVQAHTKAVPIVALGFLCLVGVPARAQFPDAAMLETLRSRLTHAPDAFPGAADIASMDLALRGNRLVMHVEIHVAAHCAVPLPGKLPGWSPLRASLDADDAPVVLRREDGHVWVALEEGIHRVRVEGLLPEVSEWEMAFALRPRRLAVDAPDWVVTGISSDGVPEAQVFFARRERHDHGEASYERQEFQPMSVVHRVLELGIVWQVHTTVRRLSPAGRAISLRVPLLPGENVLTAGAIADEGLMNVRLGASETEFAWTSEFHPVEQLRLETRPDDPWAETWELSVSPVWNVVPSGLAPSFDARRNVLTPIWTPWPGEYVSLRITRPEAMTGATLTIHDVRHDVKIGPRQRTARLQLSLQASMGQEFSLELPPDAAVTELSLDGREVPVRRTGRLLTLTLRPATQQLSLGYRTSEPLEFLARIPDVRLPSDSANVNLSVQIPENRWLLWAHGPLRGPAVRFWGIVVVALLAAVVLGRLPHSPRRTGEWMLLAIGLTQVPPVAALVVVGWMFLLAWRGRTSFSAVRAVRFHFLQMFIVALTVAALGVLVAAVAAGLLGRLEMFVLGNGSTRTMLRWYQARSGPALPQPSVVSVSIWWYRLLMLLWALWLAQALLRWLRWGWDQFSRGGCFLKKVRPDA